MRYWKIICVVLLLSACTNSNWRTASREPAGIASLPSEDNRAIIEFYAADAFSWRGWFAVHPWVAIKEEQATQYSVYEVTGWQVRRGLSAIKHYETLTPDRYWYGSKPTLLLSIKGDKAAKLIPKIKSAIALYPWLHEYSMFPGPNSNTFIAWIGNQVPELELELPLSAIGSSYAN
ncbi:MULTISPECIES: DUF3750 domain-containing protein [unclassified Colwellia]|uniref:DUF3750 domain-containing protein n=1 Tax=unclassified Colwellia TaxID=196834 RepID=UPI0015F3B69B|nr:MULTISPECIES: DUF3750 domain-containing protein [unclassified Colwellia]MBA6233731.1 DUF3750 domain-containing protein [Colwellia sp. MB02u-7]MBA6237888.1 DUF3750 domain-containing protein [Colwellia sp. MB02u-11]MBA6257203.1 DUF3750 domain-containing protein [Colwellia sp. MB3u-28]MBA6258788.1 DUF3750 domain-containing protein [Colwellia sp. MB3u-41]MBA6300453.1 DUF3750 domain-containing protein [Colwellia sp. MB3u-22]